MGHVDSWKKAWIAATFGSAELDISSEEEIQEVLSRFGDRYLELGKLI